MLHLLSRLRRPAEAKASRAGAAVALYVGSRPQWTPRDYAALAREGFQKNPVVHRAVRLVAEAAASLPLILLEGGRMADGHPLAALLARPNPREGGARFLESLYGHLLVSGNAYVEAVAVEGMPRELYALRPDRMRVVPGPDGWPAAYDYAVGSETVRFVQDRQENGVPPILHLTLFHPTDDHYGLSPMEAAAVPLDIHNAAGAWNKALLDNAARPCGALVFAGGPPVTEVQFARLKEEIERNYQGAANAGRPLLLEGGLDWKPLSLTPKDMDFIEAKSAAAREIALAFGVPPLLLGLPGDNTHANYAEANRAFYRQTVIPLARRTCEALAQWLSPAWGRDRGSGPGQALAFEPDLDAVEALASERESLWRRVSAADFLTADEKREAVGYGRRSPLPGRERSSRSGG
ncbi:MAG TPA: phage portal protein [Beijerinckiaceae bacterium]|jgi:HK97 family phage portal protein